MTCIGRDLKAQLIPTPCHGHLPLKGFAQSSVQPGLEYLQGWDMLKDIKSKKYF